MEQYRNDESQFQREETVREQTPADRFFSDSDFLNYLEPDRIEEAAFYDTDTGWNAYFDQLRRHRNANANERLFQDPAFFTVYEPKAVKPEEEAAGTPEIAVMAVKEPEPEEVVPEVSERAQQTITGPSEDITVAPELKPEVLETTQQMISGPSAVVTAAPNTKPEPMPEMPGTAQKALTEQETTVAASVSTPESSSAQVLQGTVTQKTITASSAGVSAASEKPSAVMPEKPVPETEQTAAKKEEAASALRAKEAEYEALRRQLWDLAGQKTAKKNRFLKYERQKRTLAISFGITFLLILCLIAGFILAYNFSSSKKYQLKRDQTPPAATLTDKTIFSYETLELSDFIQSVEDETEVTSEFETPIDYSKDGEQTVSIRFTDEAGNAAVETAKLVIIHDTEGPSILCEPLIHVTTGQAVAYKSYVVVNDDYDSDPEIKVDNSNVDLSKEGVYKLKYTATDKSGNKTVKKCKLSVSKSKGYVEDEDVWDLVDATLSWVVDDTMDDIHKVWAVYEYVRHIPYVASNYSYNYMYEGYKILHDNKGDCYGSFAAAKLMLDRLGYQCIPIETDRNGHHYWNMVSIDGGKTWYHFDATDWQQWGTDLPVMCMLSSDDLNVISELHFGTHRYNPKDYPATPKKSMPVPKDIPEIYGNDY